MFVFGDTCTTIYNSVNPDLKLAPTPKTVNQALTPKDL